MKRTLDGVIAALGHWPGEKIDLLVGEPCFQPPAQIRAAFAAIAGDPSSGYGPPGGLAELRARLGDWDGGGVEPHRVMVTHGAKGGLLALLASMVEPGDEVIHPLPCYPGYPAMVRRFGGVPVGIAEHGDGFDGWSAEVAAAAGARTRAVVLSSPSNPSGSCITGAELAALVDVCREQGARLILDEAYSAFCFDRAPTDPRTIDPGYRTLVRIGSASKGLALCGWRIGWMIAAAETVTRVTGVQSALLNPPATPPQRAMLALPDVPETYFERNRNAVRERLSTMVEALGRAGFKATMPAGGFYLWVDIQDRLDAATPTSAAWCERLAEKQGIGLWPGEDFGVPGHVRLALPQGDNWREAVAEFQERMIG